MADYSLPIFPSTGTLHDQLLELVRFAAPVSAVTESSPGRFQVNARSVDVFLNPSWRPLAKGQDDRSRMMEIGRAIFDLEIAMRGFLLDSHIELAPDPWDSSWIARVWVVGTAIPSGQDAEAIELRPWTIAPSSIVRPVPVRPEIVRAMSHEAVAAGAMLTPVDYGPPRDFLAATLLEGERRVARRPSASRSSLLNWILDFRARFGVKITGTHVVANAPVVLALGTHDDDVRSRVQAGLALQRVRTLAQSFGLALASHDAALTCDGLRHDISREMGLRMHVQSVLHVGLPMRR